MLVEDKCPLWEACKTVDKIILDSVLPARWKEVFATSEKDFLSEALKHYQRRQQNMINNSVTFDLEYIAEVIESLTEYIEGL
jgi:hypothetical protein